MNSSLHGLCTVFFGKYDSDPFSYLWFEQEKTFYKSNPTFIHGLKFSFRVDSVRINNCLHFNIFLLICMSVLDWKRMVNTSYADTTWVSTNLSMIHDSWMASYTPCVCFRLSWWTCGRSWQMSRQRRLWWRRRFTNNFCNSTPCSSNSKPKADRRPTLTPSRTGW